jgi:uncharacterized membrane protein YdbT with pleckstrin-like domain
MENKRSLEETFSFEPIEGEQVLWRGTASAKAIRPWLIRVALFFALVALLFTPMLILRLDEAANCPSRRAQAAQVAQEQSDVQKNSGDQVLVEKKGKESKQEKKQWPCPSTVVATIPYLFIVGFAGLGSLMTLLFVYKMARSRRYLVTTERICIRAGWLSSTLTTIDLDKVQSFQTSSSWLEKKVGIESISLVQMASAVQPCGVLKVVQGYTLAYVPIAEGLSAKLAAKWLPRDNQGRKVG